VIKKLADKIKFKNYSNIKKTNYKWVVKIICWTFFLSISISLITSGVMPVVNIAVALFLLVVLILIGIFFDIIGIAASSANETPFHSMSSRRVKAAKQAIFLVRNAEKVANFCNDVVGDIVGIVSGSATAIIVTKLSASFGTESIYFSLVLTGLVAAITVGGKGAGKAFALSKSNAIIYEVACILYYCDKLRGKGEL